MANKYFCSVLSNHFLILVFIAAPTFSLFCNASHVDERKVYIVYMGSLPEGDQYSPTAHHTTILEEILEGSSVSDALVTSYKRSFNGFAAKLTDVETQKLSRRKGEVVSIFPSKTFQPQTTRSWDFMGFPETSKRIQSIESDTIIGLLDTGIWPDSPSFTDIGFSPPPKKWKGVCAGGANFTCNKKVIGARSYIPSEGAEDRVGHGSLTSSIAAGNKVKDANFFGLGRGLARGAVPSARIAMYKVCGDGCREDAMLAAFDDAIADGVDIISMSVSNNMPFPLIEDAMSIGSYHAMAKNILTMQAAGLTGPMIAYIGSVAPWLFTVAASNTDRRYLTKLVLGNKKEFVGSTLNSFTLNATDYPLYYHKTQGTSDSKLMKGKIVLTPFGSIPVPFEAGAVGVITMSIFGSSNDSSMIVPLPTSFVSPEDFESIKAYYSSTKNPRANIFKSQGLKVGSPPQVASISSRGPNAIIPDIMKPDISAPGVDILGAYSPVAPVSIFDGDSRRTKYSISYGSSISCPHVSGAAAYVKTFHPDWSPSAIKSSIMTTAKPMINTVEPDSDFVHEFAYGSGHVDPIKAVHPGLVYEITKEDYIKMFCDIGLSKDAIRIISGNNITCPKASAKTLPTAKDLNYPSMTAKISKNIVTGFTFRFTRTVTNVGSSHSTYNSTVTKRNHQEFKVVVEPSVLKFESNGEKKTFNVTVTVTAKTGLRGAFRASLVWSDGVHNVRSPIVLYKHGYMS